MKEYRKNETKWHIYGIKFCFSPENSNFKMIYNLSLVKLTDEENDSNADMNVFILH